MKLRDYQQKAVDAVLACWLKFKTCVVVLPTGCGKTVVFGEVVRRVLEMDKGGQPVRAMILAHREELVNQACDKVGKITRKDAQVEMGPMEVTSMFGAMPPVVVSTVQTQCAGAQVEGEGRRRRMDKFDPSEFGVLVIDEAHHATAKSYRRCIDHYLANPGCRLLGVTATPDRADERALGQVFDTVAFEYSVSDAIRDGWLVPVRQKLVKVGNLDFSGISTTAGDFNQGELAEVLEEEQNLQSVAIPTVEICKDRRAIVFAVTVKQAERLCEILNRYKPNSAKWLCGKTPKEERRAILADFSAGKVQFVVNVGVLTEGFDDAGVEVIVMARPTKSRALYAQMAGRATRPAAEIASRLGGVDGCSLMVDGSRQTTNNQQPTTNNRPADAAAARRALIAASSKPSCLIIDFVGNSGRHKLVSTADILGGKTDDPDEEEARRIAKRRCEDSPEGVDMTEAMEDAREEIRARKLQDERSRAFIKAKARYTTFSVNPFDIFDLTSIDRVPRTEPWRRLSYKQRAILREKMRINPDSVTANEGKALIDEYFFRIKNKLATFGQCRVLRKHGIFVPMTFDEASKTIDRLMRGRA